MVKLGAIGVALLVLVAVAGMLTYVFWPGGGAESPGEVLGPTPSPSPRSHLILDVPPCPSPAVGVGIEVASMAAVGDAVPGDHVDVIARVGDRAETVLQDVPVVAIAHGTDEPAPTVVNLCVSPEDARRLAQADKGPGTEFLMARRALGQQ